MKRCACHWCAIEVSVLCALCVLCVCIVCFVCALCVCFVRVLCVHCAMLCEWFRISRLVVLFFVVVLPSLPPSTPLSRRHCFLFELPVVRKLLVFLFCDCCFCPVFFSQCVLKD